MLPHKPGTSVPVQEREACSAGCRDGWAMGMRGREEESPTVGSWRSQKPSTAAGERDGEMLSTAGEATKLSPSYVFAQLHVLSRVPLWLPEPPPAPWGARGCLQIVLPHPPSPDPLRSAFLALKWMLSGSCRHRASAAPSDSENRASSVAVHGFKSLT